MSGNTAMQFGLLFIVVALARSIVCGFFSVLSCINPPIHLTTPNSTRLSPEWWYQSIFLINSTPQLADPLLASLNNDEPALEEAVLGARQTISELRCSSPCKECNTTKATFSGVQEARDNLDLNKQYCVDSDGSDEAKSNENWALVESCGADNAAIWLQTYVGVNTCFSLVAVFGLHIFLPSLLPFCYSLSSSSASSSAPLFANIYHSKFQLNELFLTRFS